MYKDESSVWESMKGRSTSAMRSLATGMISTLRSDFVSQPLVGNEK